MRFLENPRWEPTNHRTKARYAPGSECPQGVLMLENHRGTQAFEACTSVARSQTKQGNDSPDKGINHPFHLSNLQDVPLHTLVTIMPANQ